jgi:hypothetical protein
MATYGLRAINDESELLIDSEYFSPTFTQKLEFISSAVSEEAGTSFLHSGYVKREYRTTSITTAGNYIVMWTLPNSTADVWYNFESSTVNGSGFLTLYVYANSLGNALTYTLPTAYVFAVSSLPATSGYGLQLFNSAGAKTYDSNNVQLAPYYISDSFTFWNDPTGAQGLGTPISLSIPTNPIFMLPNYTSLRVYKDAPAHHLQFVYEAMFKREGSNVITKEVQSYYSSEDTAWPYTQTIYNSGNRSGLGIIVADADLYAAPGTGTGTGTNPQYLLTSSVQNANEGTNVTVTLTTVNVANGSTFGYVVTGIAAADLSAGNLTGNLIIQNNNATANFTFANDLLLEGTEVFTLSITNTSLSVTVNVLDTSTPTPVYNFSTVSSINEGVSGSTTFNATNANGKVVTFVIIAPVSGNTVDGLDGTLNTGTWTVPSNAQSSIAVSYTAAGDYYTEGAETFRLAATVDGLTVATSNDITVNDTSTTTITAGATWQESSSNNVTITSTGPIGGTLYLTTSNSLVTPSVSSVYVDSAAGPLNPTGFSTTVSYTAGIVTSNTAVELYVRTGSATGRIVAQRTVTITNVGETYSFGGVSALGEGATGSITFNYSYAANKTITFAIIAPSTGATADTPADVTLTTTSFTVGNTNASGSTSVSFSTVADSSTEGAQAFRISATVTGSTIPPSDNITINDSSVSPPAASITVADSWAESSTISVTIGATNANGVTLYLTSSNALVTPSVSTVTPNSASYSANINYTTGIVTTNTSVTIYVRTGSAAGTILASKVITVTNTAASYSFSAVAWLNEGQSGSNVFNFSNAANKTITFALAAPPAGYTGATLGTDVTISTTTYTVGSSNAAGTVTVNYATVADATTEGGEYFRLSATVDGTTYYSEPIFIYDTSLSPTPTFSITPNLSSWNDAENPYVQANYLGTVSATNYTGQTLYLTTNNALVTPGVSQVFVTSNSFSTQVNWGVQEFSATTTVQLQLRTGSATGTIVATASVSVVNTIPQPSYTITGMSSSLGYNSSMSFSFNATNASGKVTTASLFPATSRATISPTSFTINSNSFTQSMTITGVPQGSAQAQTSGVVARFSNPDGTLNSSAFNILAEPAPTAVPTILSIAPSSSEYFPGETVEALITFSGPITAGTYVRVLLQAGSYGSVWYPGSASAVAPPGNGNIEILVGATSGYFTGFVNQGVYQVNNAILYAAIVNTTSGTGTYTSGPVQSFLFKIST